MAKPAFIDKLITHIEKLDRRHVENYLLSLAHEKGLLESIFNSMLQGIIVTDRELKIIFINSSAQDFLGIPENNLMNNNLVDCLNSLELDELSSLIKSDWGKLIHREIQVVQPHPRILHLNIFPLVSTENNYLGLVLIFTDITRKKEEEVEQLRSEKFQTANLMAACIAHEVGNPLNSINIHLQLMEREIKNSKTISQESLLESIKVLKKEIGRLDHTVRGFLAAARPMRPNLQGVDVTKIIDETVNIFIEEASRKKITIKKTYNEKLPKIMADEFQLKQAFSNIIKNALEAMPHGGILKISTFQFNDYLRVSFEDNGEGIHKEKLSKIFEPYFTTKTNGSGLGLMISYRIIKDHGGKIEVLSQEGIGTIFTISLPLGITRKMKLLPERLNNE